MIPPAVPLCAFEIPIIMAQNGPSTQSTEAVAKASAIAAIHALSV